MEIIIIKEGEDIKLSKKLKSAVLKTAEEALTLASSSIISAMGWVISKMYGMAYWDEISRWSKVLGISRYKLTMLNLSYDVSQYNGVLFGCTCATRYDPKEGWIHARNLDWTLDTMNESAAVLQYESEDRTYISVGVPGFAGVVSGMLPEKFAISMNWAGPEHKLPKLVRYSPTEIIKWVLENCNNFEEAAEVLQTEELSCSCIFTITGITKDEMYVIERTPSDFHTSKRSANANHFHCKRMSKLNKILDDAEDEDWVSTLDDSRMREADLRKAMADMDPLDALDEVLIEETVYSLVFWPKTGEYKVRERE